VAPVAFVEIPPAERVMSAFIVEVHHILLHRLARCLIEVIRLPIWAAESEILCSRCTIIQQQKHVYFDRLEITCDLLEKQEKFSRVMGTDSCQIRARTHLRALDAVWENAEAIL
jgi:hypothetical protein